MDIQQKLSALDLRFASIEAQLGAGETYNDPALVAKLNKEQRELEPVVTAWRTYTRRQQDLADAEALLSDPELGEMAKEEYQQAKEDIARLEDEIRILLLPRDPNDDKNVIVEIRAGVGGEEAALFAHSLFRMYSMYADARRWKVEVDSVNETELGGVKEICFTIEGDGAYSRLKFESGVHRVQRVPETESGGRIHTSTATVAVLPEVDEVDFELNPADIEMQVFRSSGAGGQHVNKTSSAVRLIHKPTGTVVECQPGAQPVPEPGQGHADPARPAVRGEGEGAGAGPHRRAPQPGGHRNAQRAYPHLQLPPGPAHRPPHRPDSVQAGKRDERRPGRDHRRADYGGSGGKAETQPGGINGRYPGILEKEH